MAIKDLTTKESQVVLKKVIPLPVVKKFPTKEKLMASCMSYFDIYLDKNKSKQGVLEFNGDALNKCTDVAMFNALGITRARWEVWKNSKDFQAKKLREGMEYIEQILEQLDQERLVTRGNAGDIFRMKVKHKWNEKGEKDKKAIMDVSTDRVAAVIKNMSK